ncbi:MAG: hypothetical protein WBM07_17140 [Chitinivibrionales bacterium]
MISYKIPKKIRFNPASAIFTATYNTPTLGKYDFNGQKQVFVAKLLPRTAYLIDNVSIGGNISSENYLGAIENLPSLVLQKSRGTGAGEAIFESSLKILGFSNDRQVAVFFETGANNIDLVATLSGTLLQTAELFGVTAVKLSISFSIYVIDEVSYNKIFSYSGTTK